MFSKHFIATCRDKEFNSIIISVGARETKRERYVLLSCKLKAQIIQIAIKKRE